MSSASTTVGKPLNPGDPRLNLIFVSPGLPSYTTLRPLVYSECSAVLLCYTGDGLTSLDAWVREVSVVQSSLILTVDVKSRLNIR